MKKREGKGRPGNSASRSTSRAPGEAGAYVLRPAKVSPAERRAFLREFPEAFEDTPRGRRLLVCLNFWRSAARMDETTGGYIMAHELVAHLAGKRCDTNFRSGPWFDDVMGVWGDRLSMKLHPHHWEDGKARTLTLQMPAGVTEARLAAEMAAACRGGTEAGAPELVYLSTGKTVSVRKLREEQRAAVSHREEACGNAPLGSMQKPLLNLLNDHLTARGRAIRNAIGPGLPPLREWYCEHTAEPHAAERQSYWWSVEALIESLGTHYPVWGYRHTAKTTRCHAYGPNAHWLPREARKKLFSHLTTLDLVSSQLAIGAALWGAQDVAGRLRDCLAAGRSIWSDVLDELDLPEEVKPALKTALYACQFGMGKRNLRAELVKSLRAAGLSESGARSVARTFLGSALMSDLVAARDRRMQCIIDDDGITLPNWEWNGETHSGERVVLSTMPQTGKSSKRRNVRTLLALEMQATEMTIMFAAADAIASRPDITVVSWLHDGITLAFSDESKRAQQTRHIIACVNDRCASLSVPTVLSQDG